MVLTAVKVSVRDMQSTNRVYLTSVLLRTDSAKDQLNALAKETKEIPLRARGLPQRGLRKWRTDLKGKQNNSLK